MKKNKFSSLEPARTISAFLTVMLLILGLVHSGYAQQAGQITGRITDANSGESLPGVTVVVKGTTTGTVTDFDGNYTINAREGDILVFSSVGYLTEEVGVHSQSVIDYSLAPDIIGLDEVIVVGYGVQRRSDLTGAITSVKVDELNKSATTSIERALQGKAAGVQVAPNTGAPGADVKIRVRGISSINAGDPIWIVDGVPASANSVNVSDIESIEILKDASTAAIYGSNGANGVILVTTKRGKPGKPKANVNYYHGWQTVPNRLNLATGPEFGAMYTELEAIRISPTGGDIANPRFPNYNQLPTYDYQDMVFRVAGMHNLDFNVSGGSEYLNVYFGLGYIDQEGIVKSSNYERFNARLNTSYSVTNWLTIGQTAAFTQRKTFGLEQWQHQNEYENPLVSAISVHPYLPPYDETGNWMPRSLGNSETPMPQLDMLNRENGNYSGNGTVYARIEPLRGLSFESRVTSNMGFNDNFNFTPTYRFGSSIGQFNEFSSVNKGMGKHTSYNWQNIISYSTTILDDFNFAAIIGYEEGAGKGHDISGMRRSLLTEDPEMWFFDASLDDTTQTQIIRGSGYENAGYSYLGRVNFDYKSKYLFQVNFRRDYSSKFGPENRVGNFPGLSVGWKFTDEDFMRDNVNFLSFGKIRYSWGRAGNSNIRDYAYYATVGTFTVFNYSFNNTTSLSPGAAPDVLPNRSIHWEDIETQNIGLDLTFFNNRLELTVDWFQRHNIGMLIPTSIPAFAGWTVRDTYQESGNVDPRPIENVGRITNKGWELQLGWRDNVGRVTYFANVNYSFVRNIATDLGPDSVRTGGEFLGISNFCRTETGGDIGDFYGYQVEGIFTEEDAGILPNGDRGIVNQPYTLDSSGERVYAQPRAMPGDFQFADLTGDGRLTTEDQTVLGNPFPKHLLGVSMGLEFGVFDLFMFWQGAFGHQIWNAAKFYGVNQSGLYNWNADYINNHYRENDVVANDANGNRIAFFPASTNAEYPRIDPNNRNGNFDRVSSFYVEDGSYLRLKNIQLGVTLPSDWTNPASLSQVRVYVGAQNLLTFTKYSGMDPEVAQNESLVAGIDKSAYPQARLLMVGASLSF